MHIDYFNDHLFNISVDFLFVEGVEFISLNIVYIGGKLVVILVWVHNMM